MKQLIGSCEFNSPSGTLFSNGHTWVRKNDYGLIKVGIDEVTINLLEESTICNMAKVGTHLTKDDFLFEISCRYKKIPIFSPVTGILEFINPFIVDRKITDPYINDWAVLIRATNFNEERPSFMTGAEYQKLILMEEGNLGIDFEFEYLYRDTKPFYYELR